MKFLRTLTPEWDNIIVITEETKYISILQFHGLIGSLISHEERLRKPQVGGRGQYSPRGRGIGGRRGSFGRGRVREKSNNNEYYSAPRGGGYGRGRGINYFEDRRSMQWFIVTNLIILQEIVD